MKILGVEFFSVPPFLARAFLLFVVTIGTTGALTLADTKAQTASPRELSPAEKLLFDRRHLQNIRQLGVLNYRFRRKATSGEQFEDHVRVKIDRIGTNGGRDVSFEFFNGKRRRPYAALPDFYNNPIIMLFLNYDIWAQSRVIGGKPNYFRNRIRDGFRHKAKIDEVTLPWPGGLLTAQKITIEPYVGDRNKEKFKAYEHKKYEIILSPDVPGEVVKISAVVPAKDSDNPNAPPLIEETLVFEKMIPREGVQQK